MVRNAGPTSNSHSYCNSSQTGNDSQQGNQRIPRSMTRYCPHRRHCRISVFPRTALRLDCRSCYRTNNRNRRNWYSLPPLRKIRFHRPPPDHMRGCSGCKPRLTGTDNPRDNLCSTRRDLVRRPRCHMYPHMSCCSGHKLFLMDNHSRCRSSCNSHHSRRHRYHNLCPRRPDCLYHRLD